MKNLYIIILIGVYHVSLNGQDDCERLFYEYNPQFLSARTTGLVMNQITQNCVDDPFNEAKGEEERIQKSNNSTFESLTTKSQLYTVNNYVVSTENMLDDFEVNNVVNDFLFDADQNRINTISSANDLREFREDRNANLPLLGGAIGLLGGPAGAIEGYAFGETLNYGLDRYAQAAEYFTIRGANRDYNIAANEANRVRAELWYNDVTDCFQNQFLSGNGDCMNKIAGTPLTGQSGQLSRGPVQPLNENYATQLRNELQEENPNVVDNTASELPEDEKRSLQGNSDQSNIDLMSMYQFDRMSMMNSINNLSKDLENLGNDIVSYQNQVTHKLSVLDNRTTTMQGAISQNTELLVANRKQIDANAHNIAATQDMVFAIASPEQRLMFKQNCISGKGVCPPGLAKMRSDNQADFDADVQKEINAMKVQAFFSTAQQYAAIAGAGLELAVELGLDNEDAKNVGDALFYANSLISIGAAIANPTPQSIMAGIQGLTGLIGGPSEPMPSPELQAILQLREEMHERFDRIEVILDQVVENQIMIAEQLQGNIEINRSIMQFEFNQIDFTLGNIVNRQNVITSQLRTLLDTDFNNCREIYETTIQGNPILSELTTYQNYLDIYNTNPSACNQCVTALRNQLNSSVNSLVDDSGLPALDRFDITLGELPEIDEEYLTFRKLAAFYRWYYGDQIDNLERATDMLFLPSDLISPSYQIYCELRNDTLLNFGLNPDNIIGDLHYLDPYAFREFIEIYSVFYPFLELQDFNQSDNYRPREFKNMIDFSNDVPPPGGTNLKENRIRNIESDVAALSQVQNIVLAQQSLMSGTNLIRPFYMILYQGQYKGHTVSFNGNTIPIKQFVTDILSKSPTIAQNFAVYVLRKNYRFNEEIYLDSTVWVDGMARNENARTLLTYGYDDLPIYSYFPQDSFFVHEDSLSQVDTSFLASMSYMDKLKFFQTDFTDDYTLAFLDVDVNSDPELGESCALNGNFNCLARIPLPESTYLFLDKFSFVGAHQYALESQAYIDELNTEIQFGLHFSTDWQEALNMKYSFLQP